MNLSPHFTLAELIHSEIAARNGIDLTPPPHILANLQRLAMTVLEPIRVAAGVPIVVTSGYRNLGINTIVGGARNSDHMLGLAADIHAVGMPLDELGGLIRSISGEIPLRKCVAEFGQWIHVSVSREDEQPKREFLTASLEGGGTVYRVWHA